MIYSISNHDLQQFWNKIFTSIPSKVDTIHKSITKAGKISKLWGAWQRLESLTSDLRAPALAPPHGLGASCARAGKRCQGGTGEEGGPRPRPTRDPSICPIGQLWLAQWHQHQRNCWLHVHMQGKRHYFQLEWFCFPTSTRAAQAFAQGQKTSS